MSMSHIAQASSDKAAPGPNSPKPSIVLVHGAFADAASWSGIIDRLQKCCIEPLRASR